MRQYGDVFLVLLLCYCHMKKTLDHENVEYPRSAGRYDLIIYEMLHRKLGNHNSDIQVYHKVCLGSWIV
jgi:hypothetical protein